MTDNLEDLVTVVDWWERFSRSYHRNSGHEWTYDQGDIAPELPERVLQVMEADAFATDERLRKAASKFMATGTQYLFLANSESRMSLQATRTSCASPAKAQGFTRPGWSGHRRRSDDARSHKHFHAG